LNENQCGFRKGYSTLDCIYSIHAFFEIIKKKKKKMYCAFVDFEKAFDNIWRVALWYKLLLNKINGKMYNFIVNMYNSIKSCIVYNDNKSDFFSSEVGVRQGENLSPFLFAVFLNDLEQFMEDKNITGLESISIQEVYTFCSSTRGKNHNFCFVNVYFKFPQFTVFIKII
jgi:hypothetical protein